MSWLSQRVWQLGIAVVMALLGAWLIYSSAARGANGFAFWLGLTLVFVAFAIPLVTKLVEAAQEKRGEEGES